MAHLQLQEDIHQKLQTSSPQLFPIFLRSPQADSPLFSLLPSEIRLKIYKDVLAPDHVFRPINFGRLKWLRADDPRNAGFKTSLLATCTRIYTETYCLLFLLNTIDISLEGSYTTMAVPAKFSVHTTRTGRFVFPPIEDATVSGSVLGPDIVYGNWRHSLRPEQWAVTTLTFYIDPYWRSWSNLGGDCLAWWTKDPVVRPKEVRLVIWVVAQFDSIPFQMREIIEAMKYAKGLKKGMLELRTLKGRERRLDEYILKLLQLPIHLAEGGVLKWDQKTPVVWDGEREMEYPKMGMKPEDCVFDGFNLPYGENGYNHEPKELEKIWWIRIGWTVDHLDRPKSLVEL